MDEATVRYAIGPGQLTLHQDRGSPMIAHSFLDLMGELGVTASLLSQPLSRIAPPSELLSG